MCSWWFLKWGFSGEIGEIHWEKYLVKIVDLKEATLVGCQMVVLIDVGCLVE